ncbi:MAG: AAA family ATPase [Methylocystaceae bacterium]
MTKLTVYSEEIKKSLSPEEEATFLNLYQKVVDKRPHRGKLYILFGPSGSGKTTLARKLSEFGLTEIVSYTTRPPRSGEVEGNDYFFVDRDTFRTIDMMETSEYENNWYGASAKLVLEKLAEGNCFVIADVNGAKQFKAKLGSIYIETICIWASKADVVERMQKRGDSQSKIDRHFRNSLTKGEFDSWKDADHVIINTDLDSAMEQLMRIVLGF